MSISMTVHVKGGGCHCLHVQIYLCVNYLHKDVVQMAYALLAASAIVIIIVFQGNASNPGIYFRNPGSIGLANMHRGTCKSSTV